MKKLMACMLVLVMVLSMSVTAFASNFVKSIEVKDSPDIATIFDSQGNEVGAIVYDKDGNELYTIGKDDLRLIITPYAKKDKAEFVEIKNMLVSSYVQISEVDHLGQLTPEMIEALKAYQANSNDKVVKALTIEDLLVTYLFDATLAKGNTIIKLEEGQTIKFAVKTQLKKGDLFFLLHNIKDKYWIVEDDCELNSNGKLVICANSLSPFAIVEDNLSHLLDTNGKVSPETGVEAPMGMMVAAVALMGTAVVLTSKAKS